MPIASGQVSVTSSGVQIAPANGRNDITFTNTTTTPIYLGASGVTTTTGDLLAGVVGASVTMETSAPVWAITSSASATVSWLEVS